jgi:hypothetical protein
MCGQIHMLCMAPNSMATLQDCKESTASTSDCCCCWLTLT